MAKSGSEVLVLARELAVAGVAVKGIALDAICSEIHLVSDIDNLFGGGGGKPTTQWKNIDDLPSNAQEAFEKYDQAGWEGNVSGQTAGTRAGRKYHNEDGQLPSVDADGNPITYREFDVNNKVAGQARDGERFVVGSDGSIYYTYSHYGQFTRVR